MRFAKGLYSAVDRKVIDRIAEGLAAFARRAGEWLAALQGGDVQGYVGLMGAGIVLLMALATLMAR
ncbi:MAG: hypothetical protein FDZ70_10195 [Actinobacteria bacterium]|nr:MAG: hypothetical protein FDZ70_10195 [Actinomycetota bacterium]